MTKEIKSVRAILDELEIGGEARFPLSRYDYVVSCRSRFQLSCVKRFKSNIDKEAGEVIITRSNDKPE